jgi:hypothetical protein
LSRRDNQAGEVTPSFNATKLWRLFMKQVSNLIVGDLEYNIGPPGASDAISSIPSIVTQAVVILYSVVQHLVN